MCIIKVLVSTEWRFFPVYPYTALCPLAFRFLSLFLSTHPSLAAVYAFTIIMGLSEHGLVLFPLLLPSYAYGLGL